MKVLKIAVPLILAIGLVLGIALPGLANPESGEYQEEDYPRQGEHPAWAKVAPNMKAGEVVEKGDSFFKIQRGEEELVTITVDENTKYLKVPALRGIAPLLRNRMALKHQNQPVAGDIKPAAPMKRGIINAAQFRKESGFDRLVSTSMAAPQPNPARLIKRGRAFGQMAPVPMTAPQPAQVEGNGIGNGGSGNLERLRQFVEEATFEDIDVGDRVAVRLVPDQEEFLAKLVFIFEPGAYTRIAGTITTISSEDKTITITPEDGEPVTLTYNDDTVFTLKGTITVAEGQSVSAVYHTEDMIVKTVRVRSE